MTPRNAKELQWQAHGLTIAGLGWGNPDNPPLLALHGWLDNANSFALLAPELEDYYVVALDLTGHGQSSRRSEDATYHVYDDLPQVREVVKQLGWEQFNLLGHSRGAIISALFAAVFPELVARLVLLDGVSPPALEANEFVSQMRRFVNEKERLLHRRTRIYETREQAHGARQEQGLNAEAARLIADRNLKKVEGGYTWTTDPRLRGASAVKLTAEQVDTVLQGVSMPTLLLIAEQGLASTHARKFTTLGDRVSGAIVESFPGGHHFHMEEGVAKLGERIRSFLQAEG